MYCQINRLPIGTQIEYLGNRMLIVKQFGKRIGTNCCALDTNEIIEFGENGAEADELTFDNPKRMRDGRWYYSYKSLVKVV